MITSDKIIIPVCNIPYCNGYYQSFSGYQPNPSFSVQYVYKPSEISDFALLQSPIVDSQSDSDNSISSTDINSVVISNNSTTSLRKSVADIKCCWQGCNVWFESLDQLSNHVTKSHAASGPGGLFYCGWEGCSRNQRGFNARYKMLVHVRTHTNEKPHQCCQCEKSFSRAENLKIHSRSHSGEKPYVCPVPGCHKAYSNSSDRFKHTRTHQVEKPYTCKVPGCPKRYTDPSSLRKHVKTYRHFADSSVTSTGQNSNIKDKRQIVPFNKKNSEKIIPNSEILTDVQNGNNEQALNNKHDSFSNYNDHRSIIVELKQDERVMNKEFDNSVISNEYEEPKMYEHINYPQNIYRYDNPSTDQYNYLNINDTYDNRTSLMPVNNYTYKNESPISVCNCMHSCCVANSLTKAADFLKLGALIDLSVNDLKKNSWNKLWTPYVQEELDTRKKYDEIRQEHMDIDLPLDLTVHRK